MRVRLYKEPLAFTVLLIGLFIAGRYDLRMAHTFAVIIGVIVAWTIFAFTWNARKYLDNSFLVFSGISYLFTGLLFLLHLMIYNGSRMFVGYDPEIADHFLIIARFAESISLLGGVFFVGRRIHSRFLFATYSIATGVVIVLVLGGVSWIPISTGNMRFVPLLGRYTIVGIFGVGLFLLNRKRFAFSSSVFKLLVWVLVLGMGAELIASSNLQQMGIPHLGGLFIHVVAWYLIYRAIIKNGFSDPYDLLFRNLNRVKEAESNARYHAENRAAELEALRANLTDMLSEIELSRLLNGILTRAVSLLNASGGELGLFDKADRSITIVANYSTKSDRQGQRFAMGEGILGEVAQTKTPLLRHGHSFDNSAALTKMQQEEWYGIMAVPLIVGNNLVGAIMVAESDENREFTSENLRLLTLFAQQAAMALRNAQLLEDARHKAEIDSLTGLYNHRHFFEMAKTEVERAKRYALPLTAIMFDIDHFKAVNDTYGHAVGDQILKSIAGLCRQLFRNVDIVGRYGGEEFAVLLPETDVDEALQVAERLRKAVAATVIINHRQHVSVTISLGLAQLERNCKSVGILVDRADKALYAAKHKGRNRICVWHRSLQGKRYRRKRKGSNYVHTDNARNNNNTNRINVIVNKEAIL